MLSQDEQVALFVDAINKDALKMCREIEKDAKKLYAEEEQKLEEAAKSEMQERLAYAQKQIMTEYNRKSASQKSAYKRELYKRREELTRGVFEKAKKALSAFADSEEYMQFLEKSIDKIKIYFSGKFILSVKKGDKEKAEAAAKRVGAQCTVKEDEKIHIGGVSAMSEADELIVDDTLDIRLSQQREWFLSHSASQLNI